MTREAIETLAGQSGVAAWRITLGEWVESRPIQSLIVLVILLNAAVLGFETSPNAMGRCGGLLKILDTLCLAIFVIELAIKLLVYR